MKTTFIISKTLFSLSIWFWLIETIFYLLRDGWHYKPIHQDEIVCDTIAVWLMYGALISFCLTTYKIVEKQIQNQ